MNKLADEVDFYRYCLRFWRDLLADLWWTVREWRRQRARALRNGWHVYRTR